MQLIRTKALQVNDVIQSSSFVHGNYVDKARGPLTFIVVGRSSEGDASDPSRATAKYRVVQLDGTYSHSRWPQVVCRRLNDDNSENPDGELIRFEINDGPEGIVQVDLIGRLHITFTPA